MPYLDDCMCFDLLSVQVIYYFGRLRHQEKEWRCEENFGIWKIIACQVWTTKEAIVLPILKSRLDKLNVN